MTIWDIFPDHTMSRELKAISVLLDQHPRFRHWVAADLNKPGIQDTGRHGLTVDSIIRAAILKQMMDHSYEELAFYVQDSLTCRAFTRIDDQTPCASTLQAGVSGIKAETWEKINRALVRAAKQGGQESGRVTRTDATVMETNIHHPSDSSLLEDGVRLITCLLSSLKDSGYPVVFQDHNRAAKKYARQIQYMKKSQKQIKIYRKLVRVTQNACDYLKVAIQAFGTHDFWEPGARQLLAMVEKVLDQTRRRVFQGESVPAGEKLFSLHEPHTDIIKKGNREIQYGHKLNLTSGSSGLIIDMVIEQGNPNDTSTAVGMVQRQIEIYGKPPRQTCFDGGYACKKNVAEIKALGVKDVAFHKKKGLRVEEMTKSGWVYQKLIKFRAGIEGNISTLKRRYGWYRCDWKGYHRYQAFAWLSVVAYNLVTLARLIS